MTPFSLAMLASSASHAALLNVTSSSSVTCAACSSTKKSVMRLPAKQKQAWKLRLRRKGREKVHAKEEGETASSGASNLYPVLAQANNGLGTSL